MSDSRKILWDSIKNDEVLYKELNKHKCTPCTAIGSNGEILFNADSKKELARFLNIPYSSFCYKVNNNIPILYESNLITIE